MEKSGSRRVARSLSASVPAHRGVPPSSVIIRWCGRTSRQECAKVKRRGAVGQTCSARQWSGGDRRSSRSYVLVKPNGGLGVRVGWQQGGRRAGEGPPTKGRSVCCDRVGRGVWQGTLKLRYGTVRPTGHRLELIHHRRRRRRMLRRGTGRIGAGSARDHGHLWVG